MAAGAVTVPIAKCNAHGAIEQAHRGMENGTRSGKLVVTIHRSRLRAEDDRLARRRIRLA